MCRRKYSFTADGGGVRGKGVGTDPVIMTEAGLIIEEYHLFTEIFLPVGEMITELISGEVISGNIKEYLKEKCNVIGVDGKETSTGKGKTPGVSRDYKNGIPKEAYISHRSKERAESNPDKGLAQDQLNAGKVSCVISNRLI